MAPITLYITFLVVTHVIQHFPCFIIKLFFVTAAGNYGGLGVTLYLGGDVFGVPSRQLSISSRNGNLLLEEKPIENHAEDRTWVDSEQDRANQSNRSSGLQKQLILQANFCQKSLTIRPSLHQKHAKRSRHSQQCKMKLAIANAKENLHVGRALTEGDSISR
ncbi:unnamed protein product [Dovyalis caffra]|uniref:Uncharacterized protein n=1 Tax=Dovyalis caffra TaxID=77055 RepID=A0AAV1RHI9_9ROSI|nr:unnamed protein product [Dovyalis caffra]